jgi:hypothetical protein
MEKVQNLRSSNTAPSSKTFRDEVKGWYHWSSFRNNYLKLLLMAIHFIIQRMALLYMRGFPRMRWYEATVLVNCCRCPWRNHVVTQCFTLIPCNIVVVNCGYVPCTVTWLHLVIVFGDWFANLERSWSRQAAFVDGEYYKFGVLLVRNVIASRDLSVVARFLAPSPSNIAKKTILKWLLT